MRPRMASWLQFAHRKVSQDDPKHLDAVRYESRSRWVDHPLAYTTNISKRTQSRAYQLFAARRRAADARRRARTDRAARAASTTTATAAPAATTTKAGPTADVWLRALSVRRSSRHQVEFPHQNAVLDSVGVVLRDFAGQRDAHPESAELTNAAVMPAAKSPFSPAKSSPSGGTSIVNRQLSPSKREVQGIRLVHAQPSERVRGASGNSG